jgi:hypothetical protein
VAPKKLHKQIVPPRSYNNHTKKYRGYLRIIFGTGGVIDTAGAKIGDFKVEYLREFEAICKKALTRESGAQVGLFDEINQRSKISWHCPFNIQCHQQNHQELYQIVFSLFFLVAGYFRKQFDPLYLKE